MPESDNGLRWPARIKAGGVRWKRKVFATPEEREREMVKMRARGLYPEYDNISNCTKGGSLIKFPFDELLINDNI